MKRPADAAFNPFAAPKTAPGPARRHDMGSMELAGLTACAVVACAVLGAATNAINGRVSPGYFVAVMGWDDVPNVILASIAQGIFEGTAFGLVFGLAFLVGVLGITKGGCSFGFALKHLLGIMAGAMAAWVVGGLVAVGLATLSPDWFRTIIRGKPNGFAELLRYAWVGGSILGIEAGGCFGLILGLVAMRDNWRRRLAEEVRFVG